MSCPHAHLHAAAHMHRSPLLPMRTTPCNCSSLLLPNISLLLPIHRPLLLPICASPCHRPYAKLLTTAHMHSSLLQLACTARHPLRRHQNTEGQEWMVFGEPKSGMLGQKLEFL